MSRVTAKENRILSLPAIGQLYQARRIQEVAIPVTAKFERPDVSPNLIGVLRINSDTDEFYIKSGKKGTEIPVKPNGDGRHVFVNGCKALLVLRRTEDKDVEMKSSDPEINL